MSKNSSHLAATGSSLLTMVLFLSLIFFALTAAALLVVVAVDGAAVVVVEAAVVVGLVVVAVVVDVVVVVVEEEDTNGLGATVEMSLMTALAWPRSESEANWSSSSSSSSKLPFLLRTEEEVEGRTCFGLCTLVNGRVCRRNIFEFIETISTCDVFLFV